MATFTPPFSRRNHGGGHSYYDAEGRKVPGVTHIIREGVPKPAFTNWAAECAAGHAIDHWDELSGLPLSERFKRLKNAPNGERDAGRARGTKVHKLAVKLADGEKVTVPPAISGHVEAYVRFLDRYDVDPVLSEFTVVSYEHGYAGTADGVIDVTVTDGIREAWPDLADRERIRLGDDIKASKSGIFGEVALQLAAYFFADFYVDDDGAEQPIPEVDAYAALWVTADGCRIVPVTVGPDQHRDFLYAAQVAAFAAGARDLVGEPVEDTDDVEPEGEIF